MKIMKPKKIEGQELKTKRRHPTHFYKLMLSPPQQSIKLRIPKKFARTRRNELSSPVILTVPTGETRKVELVEEDNDLWFRDGWEDFVEYCSIGLAYFMLFEYEGNSNFKVNVFDLTGFEISYPFNARSYSRMQHEGVDYSDGNDSMKHEIMHTSSFNSSKASDVEVIGLSSEDDECVGDDEVMDETRECFPFVEYAGYPFWLKRFQGLINVVIAAGIPLPKNPFFVAAIKEYVLGNGKYLNIPKAFGQGHLRCEIYQKKSVKLEAYDGRQWNVDCVRDKTKYIFSRGWINFARQIGLEVGDICVFELTDAKKHVLRVHVVKNSNTCRVSEDTF
ncbi:B3 domain-containing protein LOC_Os12g40080-like isoform X1 [Chenopodium quinoa]|uniref:B3 domain-containing protein LOC_Os12g40080-like isoform X1 n=1 Tax=Chenopodium quinoa TaxID=63459 RepID=UPI000B78E2A6|nr:B3 domain-containing protein LOC_Os12g40080-like isoform X1 [Chenopodium quinoa]